LAHCHLHIPGLQQRSCTAAASDTACQHLVLLLLLLTLQL
jgi:hypothetical protein